MTHRILVVEDEALLAMDPVRMMEDAGFSVIGPALDEPTALEIIAENAPDLCVLDINLDGRFNHTIAKRLAEREVPFFYLSGHSRSQLGADFPNRPLLSKHVIVEDLFETIHDLLK